MAETIRAIVRFFANLVLALVVILLLLVALGRVVDLVVDPAEREITTVES